MIEYPLSALKPNSLLHKYPKRPAGLVVATEFITYLESTKTNIPFDIDLYD